MFLESITYFVHFEITSTRSSLIHELAGGLRALAALEKNNHNRGTIQGNGDNIRDIAIWTAMRSPPWKFQSVLNEDSA